MRFSQEFIDKVREANDIVEIIGQYTELKGGHRLMGRCPFPDHNDKSPSFSVSADNQLYYCYGCKKGGNIFTFLETFQGMSFPEAVEYLARRASLPIPENESAREKSTGPSREKKDLLLKVNRAAAVFFHQQLKGLAADHPARAYLVKRGLSEDTVEKFRLGVAFEDWQGLVRYFKAKRVPLDLAEVLGLIKPKKNSKPEDSHFDLFRDRLMFPIFSSTSDVIGFGGRTLQPEGLPKYLNSSDSPVFNKSRVLYGIHETGKFIRAQDSAIVVEGYMDAISLYTAGIKNVVAILGTAFTPDHAKILKRYTMNVTMLLDGDEAGLNGAERSLPILLEAGLMPKGFALPEKMDPDDFVKKHGADRLREEVERAPELFNLLLTRRWMQGYHGSASEKVRIVEEAAVSISRMQNRQLQDLYILELSRQLDVEIGWVRRALMQAHTTPSPRPAPTSSTPKNESSPQAAHLPVSNEASPPPSTDEVVSEVTKIELKSAPRDEAFLLSLLLNYPSLMAELAEAGLGEVLPMLSHEGIREVLQIAFQDYQTNAAQFSELPAKMASRVDNPAVITVAMNIEGGEGIERKLLSDYLAAIRRRYLKSQAKQIASQLKEQASTEKLEEFMSIQRDRLSIEKEAE